MTHNFIFEKLAQYSRERSQEVFLEQIPSGQMYTFGDVFELVQKMIKLLNNEFTPETVVLDSSTDLASVIAYCGIVSSGRTAVVIDDSISTNYGTRLRNEFPYLVQSPSDLLRRTARVHVEQEDQLLIPIAHDIESVLFTSGSTGDPKIFGVPSDRPAREVEFESTGSDYSVLNLRRLTTTPFRRNLRRALNHGGRFLHVDLTKTSPTQIDEYLNNAYVREVTMTPTMVRTLFPHFHRDWLKHVRVLHLNGERAVVSDLISIFSKMPQTLIRTNFGTTEFGQISQGLVAYEDMKKMEDPVSVGVPEIPISIRDTEDGSELPHGAIGSVYIREVSGYVGELLESGEFRFEKFSSRDWYDTGDLGVKNDKNELVILGRHQETLKIRGSRISLLDVEEIVRSTNLFQEVLVAAFTDPQGNRAIGAIVVVNDSNPPTLAELRLKVIENHSLVMCPTRLIYVDHLPVLVTGKIDRVRATQLLESVENPVDIVPSNETFSVTTRIICEALSIESIAPSQDIFSAGLDSVGSLELLDDLSKAFGLQLDVRFLIQNSTCKKIVDALTNFMKPTGRLVEMSVGNGNSAGNVFWILPGANPYMAQRLAMQLSEYSHYGVLNLGCLDEDVVIADVNVMVRCLVEAIASKTEKNQPVIICGFSSAGILASEVARLLEFRNVKVRGVILLDPSEPNTVQSIESELLLPNPLHVMLGREGELHALNPVSLDHALFGLQMYALSAFVPSPVKQPVLLMARGLTEARKDLWGSHSKSTFIECDIEHLDYLRTPENTVEPIQSFLNTV